MLAIHAVCPGDIIGNEGQQAIDLTRVEVGLACFPDAVAALIQGNREALCDFTDAEAM